MNNKDKGKWFKVSWGLPNLGLKLQVIADGYEPQESEVNKNGEIPIGDKGDFATHWRPLEYANSLI